MTKHQLCQYIVSNFVKFLAKQDWPREIRIAQKVVADYPDENFWVTMDKTVKYNSLNFFLCADGREYLGKHKNFLALNLPEKEKVILQEGKVGEDVEFKPGKKTLLEFLKK